MFETTRKAGFSNSRPRLTRNTLTTIVVVSLVTVAGLFAYVVFADNVTLSINTRTDGPAIDVQSAWNVRDFARAWQESQSVLATEPGNVDALVLGGISAFYHSTTRVGVDERSELVDSAIVLLRRALVADPIGVQPQVFYVLGKAYYHKGRFYRDLAVGYLTRSMEHGYVGPDTYEYLGLAYTDMGLFEQSADAFGQALTHAGTDVLHLSLATSLFHLERFDEAGVHIERAILSSIDESLIQNARFLRADIHVRQGDYDGAINEFSAIIAENPRSADAYFLLGEVYLARGDAIRARAQWRQAFTLDPEHVGALSRLNS